MELNKIYQSGIIYDLYLGRARFTDPIIQRITCEVLMNELPLDKESDNN